MSRRWLNCGGGWGLSVLWVVLPWLDELDGSISGFQSLLGLGLGAFVGVTADVAFAWIRAGRDWVIVRVGGGALGISVLAEEMIGLAQSPAELVGSGFFIGRFGSLTMALHMSWFVAASACWRTTSTGQRST